MNCKNIILIAITTLFLIGCDPQENMGSNPLRAKAKEIKHQKEQAGREQETRYGSAISESFKKDSETKK
jgi:hypothetical protein